MTRHAWSSTMERPIEVPVHHAGRNRHGVSVVPGNPFQEGRQLLGDRRGKVFPRIEGITLGIGELDRQSVEIDALLGHPCLGKSATEIDQQLEGRSHPRLLLFKLLSEGRDLRVGDFPLGFSRSQLDACKGDGIALGQLPSDRLAHEESEEFHFVSGRVVGGVVAIGSLPPRHVGRSVLVADLARVPDAILVQEDMDRAPEVEISELGQRLSLVVLADVVGNPFGEILPLPGSGNHLAGRGLGGLLHRLRRFLRIVMTELRAFLNPSPRLQITDPEIPIRRPLFFDQVGHESRVPHSSTQKREKK